MIIFNATKTRYCKSEIERPNKPGNNQCSPHKETSHLICLARKLARFYAMGVLNVNQLLRVSVMLEFG